MNYVFVLALGIGIVAGLRSLTAPAVVAWGAHLGWLNLHGSPLAFMGSTTAVAIFSLLAIGELIADKLPMMQKRHCACAVNRARRHWRPLWRMSLCCGGEIIARGSLARWNRRHCRRFSRLRHQETSRFAN